MNVKEINVLIVDDEPEILSLLRTILNKYFDKIKTCSNGREALEVLSDSKEIGVVVSDIKMPLMNGLEFIEKLNEIYKATKCIVISGFGGKKDVIKSINLGVYDYIEKPFEETQIVNRVTHAAEAYIMKKFISLMPELGLKYFENGTLSIDYFMKLDRNKQEKIIDSVNGLLKIERINKSFKYG